MRYQVFIAEDARRDIKNAHSCYSDQSIKVANAFLKALNSCIKRLARNPFLTQIRYGRIRIAFLNRFPFGIHYKIKDDEIVILAVFHTSQSPQSWPE